MLKLADIIYQQSCKIVATENSFRQIRTMIYGGMENLKDLSQE